MNAKKIGVIIIFFIVLAIPLIKHQFEQKSPTHFTTFESLKGPVNKSFLTKMIPTNVSEFSHGSTSRMAVLVTDKNSRWLDLIKGLKSIGVPFLITTDYKVALKHKVILIYPYISGLVLPEEALKSLYDYPASGGTIIAINVLGGGLEKVFGFQKIVEGDRHREIRFSRPFTDMITVKGKVVDANEKSIKLANKKENSVLITNSYHNTVMSPLAIFENGEAAITQNHVGQGRTYALGIDLGQLLYIGYSSREEDIARTYVNHYEPVIDLFLRFLKSVYRENEPNAVVIGTVPDAKELSIMLSHDVDFSSSVSNSIIFSDLEKEYGVAATYFLQVKYIKDFNDKIFFDNANIDIINQVANKGMEIGSHSISHSRQYSKFPQGDGTEYYPLYKPFVIDRLNTRDGTVFGELRVSKFLIENKTNEKNVVSFRPGELSNPFSLPQTLLATGFKYSSSATANNSLTHLPFQLSFNREDHQLLPIYEFPVTIEDEEYPNMLDQLPVALKVAEAIAQYGGIFVVLIHPNVTSHKLDFEKSIIKYWKDRAWFGTVRDFGDWWSTRDNVSVDINNDILTIYSSRPIKGFNLQLPKNKSLASNQSNISFTASGDKIVFSKFSGEVKIALK